MDLFSIAGRIILNDNGVASTLENVNGKAKSVGWTFSDAFNKIKGAALKLGAVLLGGMGIKEVIGEVNEGQEAMAQMNAVLKSTGDASGMTKQQLVALAEAQGKQTMYSKTQVEQGENLLLTFTNIGKGVFPQATVACENMATSMHMDLNSACLTVGKALQDPVKGVTSLQREGVKLTASQKKTVAAMVQSGNVAGAQKIILGELNREFGDSAKMAGETLPGKLKILQHNLLDIGAGIMEKLLPPIDKLVSSVNSHMPQIQSVITSVLNSLSNVGSAFIEGWENGFVPMQTSAETFAAAVGNVLNDLYNGVKKIVQTVVPYIKPFIADIITIATNLFPKLSDSASGTSSVFSGVLKTALNGVKNILDWMATHGTAVKAAILGIGGAFAAFKTVSTVSSGIKKVKDGFDKLQSIGGKVSNGFGKIVSAGGKLKSGFETVALKSMYAGDKMKVLGSGASNVSQKMGGGLLNALKKAGSGMQNLFSLMLANPISIVIVAIAAVITILVVLYNKNKAFRNFVNNMWNGIKTFFARIPGFFQGIGNALMAAWQAVVGFFTNSIPAFLNAVGQWFQQLPYNIGLALGTAARAVVNFGTALWGWVTGTLPQIIQGVIQWFQQLPGRIWEALLQVIACVQQWGANTWSYLSTAVPRIINGIGTWFSQLPGKIWEFLSRVISDIGRWGSQTYSQATSAASRTISAVANWFQQLPGRVWGFLTQVISGIGRWGGQMLNSAGQAARNVVTNVANAFRTLPGTMLNIGKNIITGLWNGITGAFGWLKDKIGGFCNNVVKGFKAGFGIHSPSRVFADEVGKFMALGIGQGFTENMDSVSDQMTATMGSLTSNMSFGVQARLQPAYDGGFSMPPVAADHHVPEPFIFKQYNYSPKALSPAETARQTRNLLRQARLQSRR